MSSSVLTPVLTAHWDEPDSFTLAGYRRSGGYQALPKALAMAPDNVIAEVKASGLRSRGCAGFGVIMILAAGTGPIPGSPVIRRRISGWCWASMALARILRMGRSGAA